MTIFVCLDDRNGMLFNRRRQSRDAAVLEDIRASVTGRLLADAYSEKLLREAGIPWEPAPVELPVTPGDGFFAEIRPSEELAAAADTLVIYRWNRHYPADVRWDTDLAAAGFSLAETAEFPGRSHEKITKEVYTK